MRCLYTNYLIKRIIDCYRNVLQKARELGLRTIALPVINSVRRNYPPDAGAHIALSKYIFFQINVNFQFFLRVNVERIKTSDFMF